jgi:hypothetical protein
MLIALVGTLAFAAIWFVVLRPSSSSGPEATSAPAESAPSSDAVSGAAPASSATATPGVGGVDASQSASPPATGQSAADASQANVGEAPPATGQPQTGSSSPDAAAEVTVDPEAPAAEQAVLQELSSGNVVVMLFWDPKAADDRQARRAVRAATGGRKNVVVKVVPVKDVGLYESITGGVTIERSPTTLVMGPTMKAVTITGIVDELEIEQAIRRLSAKK